MAPMDHQDYKHDSHEGVSYKHKHETTSNRDADMNRNPDNLQTMGVQSNALYIVMRWPLPLIYYRVYREHSPHHVG